MAVFVLGGTILLILTKEAIKKLLPEKTKTNIDRIIGIVVAENLVECVNNPDEDSEVQQEKIEKAMQMIMRK